MRRIQNIFFEKFQKTIGVFLIAKNEEQSLSQALRSVQKFSSQTVVVDTGSNDNTSRIARRFGADVHFFLWNNNFSDARNYALQFLRTDWVLMLDADEKVSGKFINDISHAFTLYSNTHSMELPQGEQIGGLRVTLQNTLENGTLGTAHTYTRFFRRHPKIRFQGAIHEQIAESIASQQFRIVDSKAVIHHFGYDEISEEKQIRNESLLREEIAKKPHDGWLQYHLGLTLFAQKKNN